MEQKNKNYKTEKYIESLHEVKFKKITNEKEYNEAFEFWSKDMYHSFSAEKQRTVIFRKKLKLSPMLKKADSVFSKTMNSYIYSINNDSDIHSLSKQTYFYGNGLVYKILFIENKLVSTFICDDVIYVDNFFLIYNKKKTKVNLIIEKSMKVPFSLNTTSLKSTTARIDFKRRSKTYLKEIKKGIDNVD